MSCCNGKCGCGTGCTCGSGCKGCGMYPDLSYSEETLIMGLASEKLFFEGSSEMGVGAEHDCKCGSNCTCDPCKCGK